MQYLVSQLKKYRVFEGTSTTSYNHIAGNSGGASMSFFSTLFGTSGVPSPNNGTGGGGRSNSNNTNSN
jgi:hypothetical protein